MVQFVAIFLSTRMTTFDWPIERMPSVDKADMVLTIPNCKGQNWDGCHSYILSTRKSYWINFTIFSVNHYRWGSHLGPRTHPPATRY